MSVGRMTGEDLAAKHSDPSWRANFLTLVNVATLLRNCVINSNYKIPDDLNKAFVLTDAGTRLQSALTTRHSVPAKEARLMCLLEIATDELLVDIVETNFTAVLSQLSSQVRDGSIRYPNIFGGDLYRRAAQLFPDRRERLSSEETNELLSGTAQGVFQTGTVTVGPLGVLRSAQHRWLPPDLRVPLQHCADLTCRRVHATSLSTDYDAKINQHIPKMAKVVEHHDVARGAWTEFAGILSEAEDLPYDDLNMTGVAVAIGDCFTVDELSAIGEKLQVATHGAVLAESDRATLMQLIWQHTDLEIAQAIDGLVHSGLIAIPSNEVRRPQLAAIEVGTYGLRTEIGRRGVRQKPQSPGIAHLRLTRLVAHLYDKASEAGRADLAWQLRAVDGTTLDDRLEEYLRLSPPSRVIRDLVLTRRANVESAIDDLRIDKSDARLGDLGPAESDDDIVDLLLWKLGFEPEIFDGSASEFFENSHTMYRAIRDAQASSIVDIEHIREAGRRLFISLEGLLEDVLEYAWWALTHDHVNVGRPFTYRPALAREAWNALSAFSDSRASGRLRLAAPRTLYPLCKSFELLAEMLEEAQGRNHEYERDASSLPNWVAHTELRDFPFRHTLPFLDLLPSSQSTILAALRSVTDELITAGVPQVRNSVSHFQRSSSDILEVEVAVKAATRAVESLEQMGFVRTPYSAARTVSDGWSRTTVVMRSRVGDEVTFSRPSRIGFVGMPSHTIPQYLVREAVISSPNEVLRFRAAADSPFSEMWENYPLPRTPRRGRFAGAQSDAAAVASASHSVLPLV